MEKAQITYRFASTGRWLARCDHSSDVIELNRREFTRLSPLYQDYVWVHECVHLLMDVYDESRCNSIADAVFLLRATDDLAERQKFVEESNSMMTAFAQQAKMTSKKTSALAVIIAIALILVLIKN